MSLTSRLSRSTLTLLISSGGGALLSFALSALIGRVLGETGLGIYAAALAWVFPLWLLAEFGVETLITRDLAQNPTAAPDYLRAAALIRLTLGGGLALLLLAAAPLLSVNELLVRGLQIAAPLIVIGPFVSLFSAVFRARQTLWPVAALNIGMLAVQVPLTALVLLNGGGVLAALAVNTLTSAGQLVVAWAIYRARFFTAAPGQVARLSLLAVLRRAGPFALAGVLAAVQMRLSLITLDALAGSAAAGQYAAASRFVEAGRMLPQALFVALFPALAALSQDQSALKRLFRQVTIGLIAFGGLFGLGALLFGPPLVHLIYGPAFTPAADLLPLLAWTLLPASLKGARTLYWYAQGREAFVNHRTALALLLQIILTVLAVQQAGAVGAALALILSESTALALLYVREGKR